MTINATLSLIFYRDSTSIGLCFVRPEHITEHQKDTLQLDLRVGDSVIIIEPQHDKTNTMPVC